MKQNLSQLIQQGAEQCHWSITPQQENQVLWLCERLLARNQQFNLTAYQTPAEVIVQHFWDSWACLPFMLTPGKLVDIGAGAGFPGLALKLGQPCLNLTSVEPIRKKAGFITECVQGLNWSEVEVLCGRVEEIGQDLEYRESFDYATCRGVAHLGIVAEYALPLLKPQGLLIAQKGQEGESEFLAAETAIQRLGGCLEERKWLQIPELGKRCILCIRKVSPTPSQYPRRVGVPVKKPLF